MYNYHKRIKEGARWNCETLFELIGWIKIIRQKCSIEILIWNTLVYLIFGFECYNCFSIS